MKTGLSVAIILAASVLSIHGEQERSAPSEFEIAEYNHELLLANLRGLNTINLWVVTNRADHEIERARLQAKVELRLRQSGIRIRSTTALIQGTPSLNCVIAWSPRQGRLYRTIRVVLSEEAVVKRTGAVVFAETWDSSLIPARTTVVDAFDWSKAKDELLVGVDEFRNDWLAANPPKKP